MREQDIELLLVDQLAPSALAVAEQHLSECFACRCRVDKAIGDAATTV